MSQKIKQASIAGRIGTGIGQGIAQQFPEELRHYQRVNSINQLRKNYPENSLMQQWADVASTRGLTPQDMQTAGELIKSQNLRNAYKRAGQGTEPMPMPPRGPSPSDIQFANLEPSQGMPSQQGQPQPQKMQAVKSEQEPNVTVVNQNPLAEKQLSRGPWSQPQRMQRINEYLDQGFMPEMAQNLAAQDEADEIASRGVNQSRYGELQAAEKDLKSELSRKLETRLQKKGENVFGDVSGDTMLALENGAKRDLRLNPNANIDSVTEKWSKKGLELAKARAELKKTGATAGFESLFKGNSIYKKLKENAEIFADTGTSEEYYNDLRADLKMSPGGAAYVAFKRSPKVEEIIKKQDYNKGDPATRSRNIASQIAENIGPNDSVLAIARELSYKDPFFRPDEFFDELSQEKGDKWHPNDRQKREMAMEPEGFKRSWGDIYFLPWR